MDLVPGLVTYQWFTPTQVGKYEMLCEELCGVGHFAMRGRMVVDDPADYQKWLATQPTFADTQARPVGNATAGAASYAVCSACHGPRGEGNQQLNAPKLAGLNDWYVRRQLLNYQHQIRGTTPGDTYGVQMAPMSQIVADPATRENVLAHINTLADNPSPPTITGDAERGRRLFETCQLCHGDKGEGRWGTNAPKLAGMSDWYLVRQLEYFKARVRGAHELDIYGDQMNMVANSLVGPNAINDVVAYINTLR
jgi:cytochrome c oxidase subunit 2